MPSSRHVTSHSCGVLKSQVGHKFKIHGFLILLSVLCGFSVCTWCEKTLDPTVHERNFRGGSVLRLELLMYLPLHNITTNTRHRHVIPSRAPKFGGY